MAKNTVVISSIFGGIAPSHFYAGDGQYTVAIAMDPFLPKSDSVFDRKASGALRPSSYSVASSSLVNGAPLWILTNPKNALIYAYLASGRVVSYTSGFGSETTVSSLSNANGNGGVYYNNYLYFITQTDVARYGPLDGTPAMTTNFWTSTLGKTALVDTQYPVFRSSIEMPNHVPKVHLDNKLYFCDFKDGKGRIHFIRTTKGTDEGDTDDGSTYNALDLPFGFMPTAIESYGTDIVIAAIQTSNEVLTQGGSRLFFWNTVDESFYNEVIVPEPLVTALKNVNGILYVATGMISDDADESYGYRIARYLGGQSLETLYYSGFGSPPLQGAFTSFSDRIVWGSFMLLEDTGATTDYYSVAMSLGSVNPQLPGGVHCIAVATGGASSSNGLVTALAYPFQDSFSRPALAMGWIGSGGSTYGIDTRSTDNYDNFIFKSQLYEVGRKFTIRRILINFADDLVSGDDLDVYIWHSNGTKTLAQTVGGSSFAGQRHAEIFPDISGENNFMLQIELQSGTLLTVELPIVIEFDVESY
jgi:hypothetical protein